MRFNKYILFLIIALFPLSLLAQNEIKGKVVDSQNNEPLSGANIVVQEIQKGTSTNEQGEFVIKEITPGTYTLLVSFVGYHDQKVTVLPGPNFTKILLIPTAIEMEKVIITATLTERKIEDLPGQNEILEKNTIEGYPVSNTDELLQSISNINVNRSWGIFSKNSSVTMRGLESAQGTLILYNGVPLNKTAGGSINWHMISPDRIERIEVIKGPSSALYGNNAMGGVINIITKKTNEKISGDIRAFGGTYGTYGGKINFDGNQKLFGKKFYWGVNGFYRQGNGYIIEPTAIRDSTDVKVYLKENRFGAMVGYEFNQTNKLEVEYSFYDDKRGDGKQVHFDDGGYVKYTTNFVRAKYNTQIASFKIEANAYFQNEDFYQFTESINDDGNYKLSYKDQISRDYGIWANATKTFGEHNWLTLGVDFKQGYMDASDIYLTSTDTVIRDGKIQTYAAFIQDEHRFFNDKLKIIGGLRFDFTRFYSGSIHVGDPSANTGFEEAFSANYKNSEWTALSPKLAVQYDVSKSIKAYISASSGFMPAILDDMISSRKINKGFKQANPELQPQTLYNYEIGFNTKPFKKAQLKTAAYYSKGKDFQYFVGTGNYIDGQPELIRENIAEVEIIGAEISFQYDFTNQLTIKTNYTYNSSIIKDFDLSNYTGDDLSGKQLIDIPWHQAFAGLFWKNRFVNTTITANYIGEEYSDEQNILTIDDYVTVDLNLSKTIYRNYYLSLDIQNIFDTVFIDKKDRLSPGRFIIFEFGYKF
ncbi:MAG: TonB-dependent receptor [Bacteroidales bacterium]|jgi:iron complex outermembrane receptor protein|nr:TonB-dependent receptor [Bacteroidales bacterium]